MMCWCSSMTACRSTRSGLEPRRQGDFQRRPLALPGGEPVDVAVSIGNPHAVQLVADVDAAPVERVGPLAHARFRARSRAASCRYSTAPT